MILREMLYTCAVADMAQYLMSEGSLQLAATLFKEFKLTGRKSVEIVAIAAYKVREYGTWDEG
jgi:hypothetical protein